MSAIVVRSLDGAAHAASIVRRFAPNLESEHDEFAVNAPSQILCNHLEDQLADLPDDGSPAPAAFPLWKEAASKEAASKVENQHGATGPQCRA